MLVLLLFFCSGATALIYEVIWSKYLGLMLGSTVQAQTVVLAVFMGGLALGNKLFGKRAETFREPLAIYGYLEIVIGLYAFFFYRLYNGADAVFAGFSRGRPVLRSTPFVDVMCAKASPERTFFPLRNASNPSSAVAISSAVCGTASKVKLLRK